MYPWLDLLTQSMSLSPIPQLATVLTLVLLSLLICFTFLPYTFLELHPQTI